MIDFDISPGSERLLLTSASGGAATADNDIVIDIARTAIVCIRCISTLLGHP
jgi:hypothetical protein